MKIQRFAIGLTVINLAILAATFFRADSAETREASPAALPVLRARSLEIVDEQGRVRAMIGVFPADPEVKMPDGSKGYPETVLLRLIDSSGAPNVKIAATEDGSAMSLGGDAGPSHVQILARGGTTSLKLVDKSGSEKTLKPE